MKRRQALKSLGLISMASMGYPQWATASDNLFFKISLAEWSLHKALFNRKITNLDFPVIAKRDFGITAIEYVNSFFKEKENNKNYLTELKMICDNEGVTSLLIMCDGEGNLGDIDNNKRKTAVENHFKWLEAAKFLGCHSIRVNAVGVGTQEEIMRTATDGLHQLSEKAASMQLNVIVENHGGYSSQGTWLSKVIASVNLPNCGTLPDFGNFCVKREANACIEEYDRYKGVSELMPFAKAVSAKSNDFDDVGNCIETDYLRMLKIVKQSGYTGFIGIEYEGLAMSEEDGIRATLSLLKKVGAELN